jgi:hypothetical protein
MMLSRLARVPGLPVFLATLAIYAALVPWMGRVWTRGGDEPHYLLAAHSLVVDGDLDLRNNYAQRDYASFYSEYYLNPHVRVRADGQQVLTHNLGLSFIIAPAYALGGYPAVLYFLAAVGTLLAAQVYRLGLDLTGHWMAAAVGWAAVMFTPPVLWYVFLVYPEALAALGLIVAVRVAWTGHSGATALASLRSKRGPLLVPPSHSDSPTLPHIFLFGLGLAVLPWLSSRFLPAMGLLVAWALWRAWHDRCKRWLAGAALALAGLGGYMLFSYWLYGSASPAASYAGPTPLAVERSFALLRVGRGLLGWLFDTQRGLLITAPIYMAALWGAGLLLLRRPLAGLMVLAPFGAALAPVAVWGGFWLGWEYSARFLIAALPLLGAGVAYLWATGRRAVVVPLVAVLFGASLWAGWNVMEKPLRGIISSPIEQLKEWANLEAVTPAMARYAYIPAGREAVVGRAITGLAVGGDDQLGGAVTTAITDGPTWETAPGEGGIVLRQVDVPEFAFGWYEARLPLEAPGAAPDAAVARIRIFSPSGGDYYAATVLARDLPADGEYQFSFFSPLYNGWGFPPTVLVSATGQSALRVGLLRIEPDLFRSLGLAGIWLLVVAAVGVGLIATAHAERMTGIPGAARSRAAQPGFLVTVLAVAAAASLAWSLLPQTRTYATVDQQRTVGDIVPDAAAYGGETMLAEPGRGHEAGRLAYTHPEIYAAGGYQMTISLAALPTTTALDPATVLAGVRVVGSDAAVISQRWEIAAGDLPADGQYYSLSFDFDNPVDGALTFFVDYTGAVGLKADRIIVSPAPSR